MSNLPRLAFDDPETASVILQTQHRRIDEMLEALDIAVEVGSWREARALFARCRADLEEHIRVEEELMFPSFEAFLRSPGGPTMVMRAEHAQIIGTLQLLEDCLTAEQGAADRLEQLNAQLGSHNAKEENVLYPMFERHAPPEAYAVLLKELQQP